jgi:hypothetical protein
MTSKQRIQFWGAILGMSGFMYLWSFEFSQLFLGLEGDNTPTVSIFGHGDAPDAALTGIFYSVTPEKDVLTSDVRFYYFHGNGIGLLRYGKVGLNNTESFHYKTQDDVLSLRFNKTGQGMQTRYVIAESEGKTTLALPDFVHQDDRELIKEPAPNLSVMNWPQGKSLDRMWTMLQQSVDGSISFKMYQLRKADDTGHGEGWYHEGDFDNWYTERLDFHRGETEMMFHFGLRDEKAQTPYMHVTDAPTPMLVFEKDPRHFWTTTHYVDGGESFSVFQSAALHDLLFHGGHF